MSNQVRHIRRRRSRVASRAARGLAAPLLAGAVLVTGQGLADAVPQASAQTVAATRTRFPFADPHSVASGATIFTYGTTVRDTGACGETSGSVPRKNWKVPMTTSVGINNGLANRCAVADVMPSGAGSWANPESDIWAPSVVKIGSTWFLHYSATKLGTGQTCIGRATAASPSGPFTNQQEFACPGGGRWAIDPYAFIHDGVPYLTYRDDAITTGNQTGISSVQLNSAGQGIWPTRRSLLTSGDVTYSQANDGVNVVENPSLVKQGDRWFLFFSTAGWRTNKYATGIAECSGPLPASRCKPIESNTRPYFGFSGSGQGPFQALNPDKEGPGAMSIFRDQNQNLGVSWHYYDQFADFVAGPYRSRYSFMDNIGFDGSTWKVT